MGFNSGFKGLSSLVNVRFSKRTLLLGLGSYTVLSNWRVKNVLAV